MFAARDGEASGRKVGARIQRDQGRSSAAGRRPPGVGARVEGDIGGGVIEVGGSGALQGDRDIGLRRASKAAAEQKQSSGTFFIGIRYNNARMTSTSSKREHQ
jgi:hypothetical protein